MPSPFPGMDPYLEAPDLWPDFQNNLAPEIQGHLNPQVTPKYVQPDPDAYLDLGKCFNAVFERACYALTIDYSSPAPPPELDAEEQRLVATFLKR